MARAGRRSDDWSESTGGLLLEQYVRCQAFGAIVAVAGCILLFATGHLLLGSILAGMIVSAGLLARLLTRPDRRPRRRRRRGADS